MAWRSPPQMQNSRGQERTVGVEIEYLDVPLARTAAIIAALWGGEVIWEHEHLAEVHTRELGRFTIELDVKWMHRLAQQARQEPEDSLRIASTAEKMLTPLVNIIAPNEIATPPIPLSRLHELDRLTRALHEAGARGTSHSILYAFGVHINAEVPALDVETILAYLRAFFALYDHLKAVMDIDPTRMITGFARPFPQAYVEQVMQPDYTPSMKQLIDRYLEYNPTRNRALDLLPLFAWIDEKRVRAVVDDELVKKRPTFHFRMPNCLIGDKDWSLAIPWARWLEVEELAYNKEKLATLMQAYS